MKFKQLFLLALILTLIITAPFISRNIVQAAVLFSDNFEGGNSNGWSKSGGSWAIRTDGSQVYTQSSTSANAYTYTGTSTWSNFWVQARVKAIAFNGSNRFVGVLARYQSSSNFYYLTITNANKLELGKKVGGATTVLASSAFTVQPGTWYTLKFAVNGSQLTGTINGGSTIMATDGALTTGKIGLMASYASVSFDDIVVDGDLQTVTPSPTPSNSVNPSPSTEPTSSGIITSPTPTVSYGPIPTDGPIGWAAGTTGGQGGQVVTVTNQAELLNATQATGKYIIQIKGVIDITPKGRNIPIESDKTLIGISSDAAIRYGVLFMEGVSNIIIRNLTISDTYVEGDWDGKSKPWDGIKMEGGSHHIWIDHCNITHHCDGAIDVVQGSDYVTISWNYFYNHNKVLLIASSDSDSGQYHVTIHHNFFDSTGQRHPRVRYGQVHVYNNYFRNLMYYGMGPGCDAKIFSENNYMIGVATPVQGYDTATRQGGVKDIGSNVALNYHPEVVNWTPTYG
ncbi:MAG TPA: family 16 glycoside hydrolase, partial [Bacillota bacterium]|nr:family 16 glycoside hydrolase [Bacillota bacterium]